MNVSLAIVDTAPTKSVMFPLLFDVWLVLRVSSNAVGLALVRRG